MENPFKNSFQKIQCVCSRTDGLFIPVRQLSLLVALLILVLTLSFLGGYFLGKKNSVDEFVTRVEQDSFADQIYSSLCLLSDQDPDELRAASEEEILVQASQSDSQQASPEVASIEMVAAETNTIHDQQSSMPEIATAQSSDLQTVLDSKKFYAQLIGFGSEPAAQTFVKRMQKKSIPLEIKERESFTARGKRRVWYQVVTRAFEDKELLAKLVDRISKEEKIVGVRIVTA